MALREVVTGFRYVFRMQTVPVDLSNESDAGLMALMGAASSSSEDQTLAREALQVLHARYYPYLIRILEGFAENCGTVVIDPEEFALRTFRRAFQIASEFRDLSDGSADKAQNLMKRWLGTIARNLARDELDRVSRLDKRLKLVVLDETHDIPEPKAEVDDRTPTNPRALAALQESLAEMKPEERDILMTYAQFGFPTESGRELPKDIRNALEQRTGYERSTIRQKWHRLAIKLKTLIEPTITNTTHSPPCQTKTKSPQRMN